MTNVEFKHMNLGVALSINDTYLGIFECEKDAFYYLIINDYIENIFIERSLDD